MVQNNKVLTVSYGTFSCTLEGFDDSFDTMKAIAEYFRDLAADDRYFGAEPPQPDADMLARIAQREISRQVEARQEATGGFVLRAAEDEAAPQTAATTATAAPVADLAPTAVAEPAPRPEEAPEQDLVKDAPEDVTEAPAEDVIVAEVAQDAAREEDISEAAATEAPEVVAETGVEDIIEEAPQAEIEDAEIEDIEQEPPVDVIAAVQSVSDTGKVEDLVDEPAIDTVATEAQDIVAEDVPAEPILPADDSIAAKLQRIRAVVSRNEQMADEEDYSEDQHADGFVAEAVSDISDALEQDASLSEDLAEDSEDEVDSILRAMDAAEDAANEALQLTPDQDPEHPEASAEREDTAEDEVAAASAARVLKVKRADFEAAIAAGEIEEVSGDAEDIPEQTPEAPVAAPDLAGSLSPEDEADLLRELAEVEAEVAATRSDTDPDDQPLADQDPFETRLEDADVALDDMVEDDIETDDNEVADNLFAADSIPDSTLDADLEDRADAAEARDEAARDDLSRLMDTADEMLGDPEASSNRDAYSQLRAAVAAAEAERSAGGTVGSYPDDDPYREDLASVVRPRRPVAASKGPGRPETTMKPAPLKLVAEQRVDNRAEAAPVRPRRVSTEILDDPIQTTGGDQDGFVSYARDVGAVELHELLEAAASYMSFVEGRDQFSRPQLMSKVRQAETRDFNREDGLRSFGQLLRDGKIEKTGGGRFTASGDIGYRPDGKRAAG